MTNLKLQSFADIDLNDGFFESLKADYKEFPAWFKKKADAAEKAYIFRHKGVLSGFLYLKVETGPVTDVTPPLPNGRHLKVGTMKIDAHGTRLGERFVKKIFDHAIFHKVDDVYVTAFEKHQPLLTILKRYGFAEHATKTGPNGTELVLVKNLKQVTGDILKDYPLIDQSAAQRYLLAIYPEYHTRFLPDSKLNNESFDIVPDLSHANSIHKIYISGVSATNNLKRGDILVMYRTTDIPGKAYYRSVATSIGLVEETRRVGSFSTEQEFMKYVRPYSVFDTAELQNYYATKKRRILIKFTYNVALRKRLIRKRLLDDVHLPPSPRRWDFIKITKQQFDDIVQLGEVDEGYLIN